MKYTEYKEEIDVQKYLCVLRRRWFLAVSVFSTTVCLAILATLLQRTEYEASGKLLIEEGRTSSLTGINVEIGEIKALDTLQKDPLRTQVEIVQSLPILEKTIAEVKAVNPGKKITLPNLREKLEVEAISGTDILQISYQDSSAQVASSIVNVLMNAYISNNIENNREEAIGARKFIAEQLPQTESAVSAAEESLRQFKELNDVVDLDQEATQAINNIDNLNNQIDQIQAEQSSVNARLLELRRQIGIEPETAIELNNLSQSPGVQEVLTKLQEVESQLAIARAKYQSIHPTVLSLQRQIDSLDTLLQQRIETVTNNRVQQIESGNMQLGESQQSLVELYLTLEVDWVGLSQQISELSTLKGIYENRSSTLPALEKAQRELERRLQAAQITYEALLAKLQEVQVAENQNVSNARVIEAATVPEKPASSQRGLILVAGIIAGSLLGISAAFARDFLDRSMKTLSACREQFGYTLLGVIPAVDETGDLTSKAHSGQLPFIRTPDRSIHPSVVTKAYQMLWSNLKSVSSRLELKTIVITSTVAGEGKSEVSANLATLIAKSGQRVLLIDADMRCPSLHKTWNISNKIGLRSFLAGQSDAQDTIQKMTPYLHLLPSGEESYNSVDLLNSSRMESLVSELSNHYDFVILDSSPFISCADPSMWGKVADGIVLVVRPEILDAKAANAAQERIASTEQRVIGMVVNALDVRNDPDSYFYSMHHTQREEANLNGRYTGSDTVVSNQGIFRL